MNCEHDVYASSSGEQITSFQWKGNGYSLGGKYCSVSHACQIRFATFVTLTLNCELFFTLEYSGGLSAKNKGKE